LEKYRFSCYNYQEFGDIRIERYGVRLVILESARKHGISDNDMIDVVDDPYVIKEMRVNPTKMMFLGFDSKARAIEVITDTGTDGQVYVIHADLITKQNDKLLEEVLL